MDKKKILWAVISLIIAIVTIKAVSAQNRGFSGAVIKKMIRHADLKFLIPAILMMTGFIIFEGMAINTLAKDLGCKTTFAKGLLYSGADIYFSAITPSASGGQPASAFFMMKNGISGAKTSVILLINLIFYTLGILVLGLFTLCFRFSFFLHFGNVSKALIIFGFFALSGLAFLFYLLLKKPDMIRIIGEKLLVIPKKLHLIRNTNVYRRKIEKTIKDYDSCSHMMLGKSRVLWKVFLWNVLQRFSQFVVSFFVFLAMGKSVKDAVDVISVQCLVTIGSNCIPVPGGMGVADYLMLDGFRQVLSKAEIVNFELICRGITFYGSVVLGLLIVLVGLFHQKKVKKGNKMLGYYDYTVLLTYGSLVSAMLGILISLNGTGHPYIGIFFLMVSGLCDAFDGKVARMKQNRTQRECKFGIQIDSLSDLVAFGVLPACIGNAMLRVYPTVHENHRHNMFFITDWPNVSIFYAIMIMYVLAALIRLAYFNVDEEERQQNEGGVREFYLGLPVTSASLILPFLVSFQFIVNWDVTPLYFVSLLVLALAFLSPIHIKKPGTKGILIMVIIGAIDFLLLMVPYILEG